jgi:hypothetical protein
MNSVAQGRNVSGFEEPPRLHYLRKGPESMAAEYT